MLANEWETDTCTVYKMSSVHKLAFLALPTVQLTTIIHVHVVLRLFSTGAPGPQYVPYMYMYMYL